MPDPWEDTTDSKGGPQSKAGAPSIDAKPAESIRREDDETPPSIVPPAMWTGPAKPSDIKCPPGAKRKSAKQESEIPKPLRGLDSFEKAVWCEKDGAGEGPWLILSADGRASWGELASGMRTGRTLLQSSNGDAAAIELKDDVAHGEMISFENGKPKSFRHVEFGENHGMCYWFFPDGKIETAQAFHRGVPHGTTRVWSADGQLVARKEYRSGTLCHSRERSGEGFKQSEFECPLATDPPQGKWESRLGTGFSDETRQHARVCDEQGLSECALFSIDLVSIYQAQPWNMAIRNWITGLFQQMCLGGAKARSFGCPALEKFTGTKTCFLWSYASDGCTRGGYKRAPECAPSPSICDSTGPGDTCMKGQCVPASYGPCDCP